MSEPEQYRTKVTLYRCACRHCDAAQEELRRLADKHGAVLEIRRVDRDERLRGLAGWSTPVVAIDGVGITQFKVDAKAWEEALLARVQARPSALVGAVVDMCCYFRLGARPEGHETCARECFAAGGPVGLATLDGRVFLALPDRRDPAVFASLKERPGERVRVEGEVRLRDGLAAVVVSLVEAA